MSDTKQIVRIDASSLKQSSCGRRLFLDIVKGYRGSRDSNDLVYGSAFHKCVETYAHSKDEPLAHAAAMKYWSDAEPTMAVKDTAKYLNAGHLSLCCQKFFDAMKKDSIFTECSPIVIDGEALVEKKFSIPIYSNDTLDILLQGTIDGLYQIAKGCANIGDWKTTRSYNPIDYFYEYKLSVQLRTYLWAVKWMMSKNPDSPIAKALSGAPKIGCFIYGAFLSSKETVKFMRSEVFQFSEQDLAEYESMLMAVVCKLVVDINVFNSHGVYPQPQGIINSTCKPYGKPCKYFGACSSHIGVQGIDPKTSFQAMLDNHFVQKEYKPLTFGGGKVE